MSREGIYQSELMLSRRRAHSESFWRVARTLSLAVVVAAWALFVGLAGGLAQTSTNSGSFLRGSNGPSSNEPFDHAKAGFALTNSHASVACEQCHVGGRFKNTPRFCEGCHNGSLTTGMPASHPPTTQKCDGCHQTSSFRQISVIDHTQASNNCAACHNGAIAVGKKTTHIATIAPCDTCHKNTLNFALAVTMDHTGIVNNCASCHNNIQALGKGPNHFPTNLPCEDCHKSTVTFLGASFTHSATDTFCASCHNGAMAKGLTTPPHIPTGVIECSNCHTNTATSFATYTMNHPSASALRCDACHNGAFTGEGAKGAQGTAAFANHVATAGRDCSTCHAASTAGGYVTWAGGIYVHAPTDTNCSTCHNNTTAKGLTTPPHVPVAGVQCGNCHTNTSPNFITYTMNHPSVSASRCDACHSGAYTGEGALGAQGTASFANHLPTAGRDCLACHAKSVSGGFQSWAGGGYVHSAADTNCLNCHNGSVALGLTTPPHVPVAGVQCSACHVNTSATFVTYSMSHASVSSARCDSCHNGAYMSEGTKGAFGTSAYAGHVATGGRDCLACHTAAVSGGFVSFAGAFYVHAATDTNCLSCHNGATATGNTSPPHVPIVGVQCSNCHVNTATSFIVYTMNHSAVTAARCDSCHNGSFTGQGAKGAFGTAAYAGHVATGGRDCVSCHASAVTGGYVSFAGALYTHAPTDTNCLSCHNGTTATGHTTPPHIPVTGVQCSGCHVNSAPSFATYTMDHSTVASSRCDSCHNGSFGNQGVKGAFGASSYAGHLPTAGRDCTTCHTSAVSGGYVSWSGAFYSHAATDTNCSSCHNGTTATGNTTPPHIPVVAVQCSNCHVNTAPSFISYTMSHASVSASRCDACHGGGFTGQGVKGAYSTANYPGHVPTAGRDCAACHANAVSGGFVAWAGGTYAHTAADTNCSSCHNGSTATGETTPPHIPTTGVQCSNCHVNTSTTFVTYTMNHASVSTSRCDTCHSGAYLGQGTKGALGTASYSGHVATSGRDCAICHANAVNGGFVSWAGATYTHTAADTNCSTCHNGSTATGQTNPPHIPIVGVECSNCHVNTATSFVTYTMTHSAVSASRCDACHNGAYQGQGTKGALSTSAFAGHVATGGRDCATCHASAVSGGFVAWSGGTYIHLATDTNCSTCHNNSTAKGMTTPPHIPSGASQCGNCHSNTAAAFTIYTMSHASVSAMRCDACHNGSYTGEGAKGAIGTASFVYHVATNGQDCVACHSSAAAGFTSWTGGTYVHQAGDVNCIACHDGHTALGFTTPPHIPTTGAQCGSCHTQTAPTFTTYNMSHAAVSTSRCDACHNGSYTGQGTKGALGTASFANHVATSGYDCVSCHASAAASFVSWSGGQYVHQPADTNCVNCHNGAIAMGLTTPPHIPTAALQCSNCHTNTATSFATYTMTHSAVVTGTRCDACHNGSYTTQGTKGATGTAAYPNHVATAGRDCITCHASAANGYVSWAGASYTHLATDTNCSSCHNNTNALGLTTPPHVPVAGVQCSSCHVNTATSFITYTMTHSAVTASRCDSCHDGTYTSQGTKGATGSASYAGHVATSGRDCVTCHAAAVSGGYVSWSGATYTHLATDTNCSNCHNGTTATGHSTPPHIPVTGVQCSSCHVNTATSFATYTMTHSAVTASRCDSCHNGSYTGQGTKGATGTASYSGHVATSGNDCVTCHASAASGGYVSWAGGVYTHAPTDTICSTCHNGTTATGHTTPPHIPVTGIECSNCHVNTASSFATYTMTHSAVTASRCDACHNGSYAGQGTKGAYGTTSYANHVATSGRDCVSCHATAASGGYVSWAGGVYLHLATDTVCSTCHNGATAKGMTNPPHIPSGATECSNCHVNTAPSFVTYTMTHSAVSSMRCDACHNGSYTSEGTKGAMGTASYPNHVAPAGRDCISCHASAAASFTSWSGGSYLHLATDTNCSTCHNGSTALGLTTPPHIPTTTTQCSNCHVNTAASFTTYTMVHSSVSAMRCDACHNGSYTTQGASGATGTAAYPNHVATGGRDCSTCHATAAANFSSWSGGTYTHLATDTNCSTCHNGTNAQGLTTPPHIPVTGVQCSNCHANTSPSFTAYTMSHASVATARCDSCHNGSYTGQGTKGAYGTSSYSGHVATNGQDCGACHTTAASGGYVTWAGAVFVHAATDTNCLSCHNGTTATGNTSPPHIPITGIQCSNCHSNTATSFTTYTMTHSVVTAMRCDACHDGSFTTQGTKGAMGTASYSGHVATSGRDCITCHATAQSGGYLSWAGGTFAHAVTDTICSSCHNGTTATGETTPPHIPVTGIECSNCHVNTATSFTTYTMSHAAVHATRCDACHSGAYKSQGTKGAQGPDHGAKSVDCGCCHVKSTTTFTSWSNPQSAVAGCTTTAKSLVSVSPNARNLLGASTPVKLNPMIRSMVGAPQGSQRPGALPAPQLRGAVGQPGVNIRAGVLPGTANTGAPFNHSAASGPCASCHNGVAAIGKPAKHIPTTAACDACHKSTTTFAGVRFDHKTTTAACSSCHNGALAPGKPARHVVTTAACDTCHKSPRTFGGALFDHSTTTSACAACHNGAVALGKPARHIATTAACDTCHKSTTDFAVVRFDHATTAAACSACHNGIDAVGKPQQHIVTAAACDSCHKSTHTFGVVRFDHGLSAGPCASCHNGVKAEGKPIRHVITNAPCEDCHVSTNSFNLVRPGVGARGKAIK